MNRRIVVVWVLISGLLASTGRASDFMDVRLTWTLADNNLFAEPGETYENSPGIGIGAGESNTVFFDNYETKYTGFETFGHLVLYKRMPAFFDGFEAEAALFMKVSKGGLRDEGSYIRMSCDLSGGMSDDDNLELTLFPLSADRFRLGYSYKVSWGGNGIFPLNYGLVPGARLQLNQPWGYSYLGFKTTQILEHVGDTEQTDLFTNYAVLGGLGFDIEGFRVEAGAGYFTRGAFAHEGVRGDSLWAAGASYQIGYHHGTDIGTSVDFELYANDPAVEELFFRPEVYDGGLSFVVKHEGTFLVQTLMGPDAFGETTKQNAFAFDLNAAMKWGFSRLHIDVVYRSLSFILFEVPSFTPYQDYPRAARVQPAIWAAIGFDHHFPRPRLTPGIKVGVYRPATYTIESLDIGGLTFAGKRTVVIHDEMSRSVLPVDEEARLAWSVKASLKWDYAEMLALVMEVYYTFDDNQIQYLSDFAGLNVISRFVDPNILGLNLMAQARF